MSRRGSRTRKGVVVACLLATLAVVTAAPVAAPAPAPVAELSGEGGWGWKVACVGCIGTLVYLGYSTPLLMIYMAGQYAWVTESCSLACIKAVM